MFKFSPVPGRDVPIAGKKLVEGWLGYYDHQPELGLAEHAEQVRVEQNRKQETVFSLSRTS